MFRSRKISQILRGAVLAWACISPLLALDANGNGISDVWEAMYSGAAADFEGDADGDGTSNRNEGLAWTNPFDPESVFRISDFLSNGNSSSFSYQAVQWMRDTVHSSTDLLEWTRLSAPTEGGPGTPFISMDESGPRAFHSITRHQPLNSDTDGLNNKEEKLLGTDPLVWDTDGDKVPDCVEFLNGTNSLSAVDSDGDGIPDDWKRWIIHSDPDDEVSELQHVNLTSDFDGDGVPDFLEFQLGTSPVTPIRNVILFLSEDQSIDLGCMGTVGLATPHVDSFAQSAVLFERAFCLAPVCSPSKMAMFTGTYPHTNSATRNVSNYGVNFPLTGDPSNLNLGGVHEDLPTLIEILRDRGYFTATSHKSHVQPVRKWPFHKGYGQPTTVAVAQSYIDDLVASTDDRPFYMTFGIGAPHLPFRGILQAQGKWSATGGLTNDGHATTVNANAIVVPNCYPDEPGVRQDYADYYGAIQCVDTIFGAVMERLNAIGILDETLVIYTSDHGIGLHRAKQSIYSMGTQIPLLIGGAGIQGNIKINAPVSHLDLVPTILDFLDIHKPSGMLGTSLMPILQGVETRVPGRETVMASTNDKYDSRAVCDGRYYYVRNLRKISGSEMRVPQLNAQGIDPVLDRGLNTDQCKAGSPWFNRTYDTTLAASGSVGNQLLSDLLSGRVPDEELFDLNTDPWCVNNLADDPAHATVKAKLRAELSSWRRMTEDYNTSPTETSRRTERFTDPTNGGGEPDEEPAVLDDFNGKTGNLGADPQWSTLVSGNAGADYFLGGDIASSPGGPITLSRWLPADFPTDSGFTIAVETGFSSIGVAGGIAFGIVQGDGGTCWWQFMLADGRSAPGGVGKDIRLFRVENSAQLTPPLIAVNNLADFDANGSFFHLQVSGTGGSPIVSLKVLDPEGDIYYQQSAFDLGMPILAGSGFGLTSWSSASSIFDDFALTVTAPPRSVLLDVEPGIGKPGTTAGSQIGLTTRSSTSP